MPQIEFQDLPTMEEMTVEQLKKLFGAGRFRPQLEMLEERLLKTGGIELTTSSSFIGAVHTINVTGTEASDVIRLSESGNEIHVEILDTYGYVRNDADGNPLSETIDRSSFSSYFGPIFQFHIDAKAGNDTVRNDTSLAATIQGGVGSDLLYGGSARDVIYGDSGVDYIYGHAGNDWLYGGDHRDYIWGGDGNDRIYGNDGNDYLYGDDGNDTVHGNDGNDILSGRDGDDQLFGGYGNDSIWGGNDDDLLSGDWGDDKLYGQAGADTLQGWDGNDYLSGGSGNDELRGGFGGDTMWGGAGEDYLYFYYNSGDYVDGDYMWAFPFTYGAIGPYGGRGLLRQ